MGIEALDITFRLEKAFGIRIPAGYLYWSAEQRLLKPLPRSTATVGEVHQRICELLVGMKPPVPDDSWELVTKCIGGALSIPPNGICAEDRLIEDLGVS